MIEIILGTVAAIASTHQRTAQGRSEQVFDDYHKRKISGREAQDKMNQIQDDFDYGPEHYYNVPENLAKQFQLGVKNPNHPKGLDQHKIDALGTSGKIDHNTYKMLTEMLTWGNWTEK